MIDPWEEARDFYTLTEAAKKQGFWRGIRYGVFITLLIYLIVNALIYLGTSYYLAM